ncbi:Protein CBG25372 [Caenorhabditis briggsae]|nr:Protein CBG25372 [Caenorhabditis briggsae]CAR99766.1 Protein CBG25372 [Caenorhabditis briggsae]
MLNPTPTTNKFPLLRLPEVILLDVLHNYETVELVDLSLCSKVCKSLAKYIVNKKKAPTELSFFVDNQFEIRISFQWTNISWTLYLDDSHQDSGLIRVVRCSEQYQEVLKKTYWLKGFSVRNWLDHISSIFNVPLHSIWICGFITKHEKFYIQEMMKGLTVEALRVSYFVPDDYLKMIMEKVLVGKHLTLKAPTRILPSETVKFDMETLIFESNFWLKPNHVLAMNCHIIDLGTSKWKAETFNTFINLWMENRSKLKMLQARSVEGNKWSEDLVLKGLDSQEVNLKRTFHLENNCFFRDIKIERSFDINWKGTTASIILENYNDAQTKFMFLVWRET